MFCGGSFRAKTIDSNDEYRLVRYNNAEYKLTRSASLRPEKRKSFIMPRGFLENGPKRFSLQAKLVSDDDLSACEDCAAIGDMYWLCSWFR